MDTLSFEKMVVAGGREHGDELAVTVINGQPLLEIVKQSEREAALAGGYEYEHKEYSYAYQFLHYLHEQLISKRSPDSDSEPALMICGIPSCYMCGCSAFYVTIDESETEVIWSGFRHKNLGSPDGKCSIFPTYRFDKTAYQAALAQLKELANDKNAPSTGLRIQDMELDAEDLTELDLSHLNLTDSALETLKQTPNLTTLFLHENQISDINVLSGLTTLELLSLHDNYIKNISPLARLSVLKQLYLGGNVISDITALKSLSKLENLDLAGNEITDISALTELTNLRELFIGGNPVSDDKEQMAKLRAALPLCDVKGNLYDHLTPINHLNYGGVGKKIYCRMLHELVDNLDNCHDCPLLAGSLQGAGVECYWDDVIENTSSITIGDPQKELERVEELIILDVMGAIPMREGRIIEAVNDNDG